MRHIVVMKMLEFAAKMLNAITAHLNEYAFNNPSFAFVANLQDLAKDIDAVSQKTLKLSEGICRNYKEITAAIGSWQNTTAGNGKERG